MGHVPCPVEYQGLLPNVQVAMRNLTPFAYDNVFYVADTPDTSLSNMDELLGEVGFAPGLAFKIDYLGLNTPLISESLILDGIWQPGEVWEFVIQEYFNTWGTSPAAFGSIGIGGASGNPGPDPLNLSSGSIVVPEPGLAALVALGGLAVLWRRRR